MLPLARRFKREVRFVVISAPIPSGDTFPLTATRENGLVETGIGRFAASVTPSSGAIKFADGLDCAPNPAEIESRNAREVTDRMRLMAWSPE
jgi:hypothetical protein